MERIFAKGLFCDLKDDLEVKSSVSYLAHDEFKFRQKLASEGLYTKVVQI